MMAVLAAMTILVVCANLLGWAAMRAGLPDIIGFLVAGLIFGPTGLHIIGPQITGDLPTLAWRMLSNIGLAALMFTAGVSMPTKLSPETWRHALLFAGAIIICLIPAFLTAPWIMVQRLDPAGVGAPNVALAYQGTLALAVIVTSVPFLTKILINTGLLNTQFGSTVLSTACVVDLIVWTLFPLLVAVHSGKDSNLLGLALNPALTILMLLGVAFLVFGHSVLARKQPGFADLHRVLCLILLAAMTLFFAILTGVGVMLAFFAMGLGVSSLGARTSVTTGLQGYLLSRVLIPIYFSIIGTSLNLHIDIVMPLIIEFLIWSYAIKIFVVMGSALLIRNTFVASIAFGLALNTRGGPGIALASLAISAGLIGTPTFVTFVIASIITSILAEVGLRQLQKFERKKSKTAAFRSPLLQ